ncbi:MAG TPA: cation transporter [Syntrophorhabdaceae bacterium]|nr:cation transporter [Syntrophorhabdaceae bacterium]
MIRSRLDGLPGVKNLVFDVPRRLLQVYHTGDYRDILDVLDTLKLETKVISSDPVEFIGPTDEHSRQRRVLWQVLAINLFFFAAEMVSGLFARSMGLVADSLDMLADSIVYGLSLLAVGGSDMCKKRVAGMAGYFQAVLAIMGFMEVVRRFIGYEPTPDFRSMIVVSISALAGNIVCLYLLLRSKSTEAHMQASMIFTSMDVIVNIGVIIAGVLVCLTNSKIPDLAIGTIVFALVSRGAYRIFQLSK